MGHALPLVTLFGAVAVAVWAGGPRVAAAVAIIGYLACNFLFMEPRGVIGLDRPDNLAGLLAYLVTCSIIIGLGEGMRRDGRRAQENEERLRTTLASIGDAVIATDTEGRITSMNPVAESLTGWKVAEATGMPLDAVFRVVNEKTRQPVENPLQKVLQLGDAIGLADDTLLIARDGTELPIGDSAAPIRHGDGEVAGCVLVFRDVTKQRNAEIVARHLAAIVDSSIDAIISKDTNGIITSWNRAAERLFGYSAAEAVGKPIAMLATPDKPAEMAAILARIRQGERVEHFDTVRRAKDGRLIPISLSVSPIKDEHGQVVGASKIARDISERAEAEEALRLSESQLAYELHAMTRLQDLSGRLVQKGDLHAALQEILAAAAEFTDTDKGNIQIYHSDASELRMVVHQGLGEPFVAFFANHGWDQGCGRAAVEVQRVIVEDLLTQDHLRDTIEGRILLEDGIRAFQSTPLTSRDGRLLGMLNNHYRTPGTTGDRKMRYVDLLARLAADLIERQQAEEALSRQAGMLREADQRKNEFLATLSHELRNPLAPIRNAIQVLLAKATPDAEAQWGKEVIERQVRQMARLLDDLLDVSRITHNKLELRKETIELATVVQNAIETSRPLIEAGGHELVVTLPPVAVFLDADPVRLAQVFLNLLNNAAKYSERGGRIQLTCERQGSNLLVSVKDAGVGISPDMLSTIFDMFAQEKWTLERSQGGLGIGLSLVRGLVELHGGTIEARSEGPDQGSEFIVRLPVVVQQPAEQSPRASDRASEPLTKHRLLIVDDLRDSADSLAMLLNVMGHEVHTAYDGEDGVNAAAKLQPDVILLDIGMPKLNGYDACRLIRQRPGGEKMFLVALTGLGQEDDRRRTMEAGFDDHMVKPVDIAALLALLTSRARQGPIT